MLTSKPPRFFKPRLQPRILTPLNNLPLKEFMNSFETPLWSLRYPENWQAEEEDELLVLFDPQGVGELSISYQQSEEPLSNEDLLGIADEDIEAGAEPDVVNVGQFSGIQFDYESEGEYWCEWYLANDDLLIFATYNCPVGDEEKELAAIEVVLSTLKSNWLAE